jgi:hypothetical protein
VDGESNTGAEGATPAAFDPSTIQRATTTGGQVEPEDDDDDVTIRRRSVWSPS